MKRWEAGREQFRVRLKMFTYPESKNHPRKIKRHEVRYQPDKRLTGSMNSKVLLSKD